MTHRNSHPQDNHHENQLQPIENLLYEMGKETESYTPSKDFQQKLLAKLERRSVYLHEARAQLREERSSFGFFRRHAFSGLFATILVVSTSGLTTFAYQSSSVTDGSIFYPVKRVLENVERSFASTPEEKIQYYAKMSARRLEEIQHLSAAPEVKTVTPETARTLQDFSNTFKNGFQLVTSLQEEQERDKLFTVFDTIAQKQDHVLQILEAKTPAAEASVGISTSTDIAPDATVQDRPASSSIVTPAPQPTFTRPTFVRPAQRVEDAPRRREEAPSRGESDQERLIPAVTRDVEREQPKKIEFFEPGGDEQKSDRSKLPEAVNPSSLPIVNSHTPQEITSQDIPVVVPEDTSSTLPNRNDSRGGEVLQSPDINTHFSDRPRGDGVVLSPEDTSIERSVAPDTSLRRMPVQNPVPATPREEVNPSPIRNASEPVRNADQPLPTLNEPAPSRNSSDLQRALEDSRKIREQFERVRRER